VHQRQGDHPVDPFEGVAHLLNLTGCRSMNPGSLLFGRSFGVVGALFVLACSGNAFSGKEGQQELETGGSASTLAGSGGSETPDEGPGAAGKSGRTIARGGAGGAGAGTGGATTTVEPSGEGGDAPDAGGTGGTAGNELGGTGGVAGMVVVVVGGGGGKGPDPEPGCDAPVHDTWEQALGTGGVGNWHVEFGDPHVDLATHELIVSYDDVATRDDKLVGGYAMSAEVTLSGYTAFTPYPKVWEVVVPTLRRSLQGTGVELGATSYGSGNPWRTDLFPGFGGVTLLGTTKVRVTTYVQADSEQYAIKVEAGDKVVRSGWLGDFHWADTNLQVFRFVGENNSAGGGDSDVLRVGAVDGCQKLSDADVLKRYSE
jgi:hypothetical protein